MIGSRQNVQPSSGRAANAKDNIDAILPLLPNQQALLLLSEAGAERDPGFLQVTATLKGRLDRESFDEAWNRTIAAHQGLRASIHQRKVGRPLIIVRKKVVVSVDYVDWSGQDADQQRGMERAFRDSDRSSGLDLSSSPPMRLVVAALDDDLHELIWTCHHIFSDGWSATVVLEDVVQEYNAIVNGADAPIAPTPKGLQAYYQWAAAQSHEASTEQYWRDRLAGFAGAPRLGLRTTPDRERPSADTSTVTITRPVSAATVARVIAAAADLKSTPNGFVQAAWALTLSQLFSSNDVVFGTTVAGRAAPITGMERIVGYFSNAVPIRAVIDDAQSVAAWIVAIRDDLFTMQPHEHASLGDIQGWSDVPGHRDLFETFIVFENLPDQGTTSDIPGMLTMSTFRSGLTAAFPLALAVTLGDPWMIDCRFDPARIEPEAIEFLLEHVISTMDAMASDPDRTIGQIRGRNTEAVASMFSESSSLEERSVYQAPSTPLEADLVALWEEILGLEAVGTDDDYFALGGTSLGAVRLFARIEDELGISLPLNTLLANPTVASLASTIEGHDPTGTPKRSIVVPLQESGSRVPLVCIHGGGGEILYYKALADRLGTDQPVYGIEPVGLDRTTPPLESVPEMARLYIEELRRVQPSGPYRLVGFCFGGSVALEMATQLESRGEAVDFIAVIDAGLPLKASRASTTFARARAVYETRGFIGAGQAAIARMRNRGQYYWDGSFGGADGRERAKYHAVAQACRRAFGTWEPKPTRAPIRLIRSTEYRVAEDKDWHLGWDAYTPSFEVETVEGSQHVAMFEEPSVDRLAGVVRDIIDSSG